jgi:NADH:quinone reductase (non-electrogenic)
MKQDRHKIVVIGGGYVGATAATRAAGRTRGRAEVKLIDPDGILVQRLRLHRIATDQRIAAPELAKLCGRRVEQVRGWAESIELDKGVVRVRSPENGASQTIPYDSLIVTTGSIVDAARVPGVGEWAHPLSDGDSARRLGDALRAAGEGTRVTVAGGGLTGLETAAEIAEARPDLRVSLVTRETFGTRFSSEGREHLVKVYSKLGIDVLDGVSIQAVGDGALEQAQGPPIPFDIAVWCGGFARRPLAAESGLAIGPHGGALVDGRMRSVSHPEVLVAGDAAECAPLTNGGVVRMSCQAGIPAGAHAADVVAASVKGRKEKEFDFGYLAWCVSLGRKNAVVQWVDRADHPKKHVTRGRRAVWFKELVTNFATQAASYEKRWTGSNMWLSAGRHKTQDVKATGAAGEQT